MLRSSHDACGCSTQTTSTINLKRSTLHPHEGQADRPNTPSDSVYLGSNPGPPATNPSDRQRRRSIRPPSRRRMKLPHSNGHWRGFGGPPELFDRLRIGHVRRDRRTEEYIVIDAVVAEKIALLLAEM